MPSQAEIIRKRGEAILRESAPWKSSPIWESLNRQQRLMVRGWLGKGRIATVEEALDKILKRIEQDSMQGYIIQEPEEGNPLDMD